MPLAQLGGLTCHYRIDGADDLPVLMFAHALGLDLGMWDAQASALSPHLRTLRYDLRGQGATSVSEGDYSIAQLGADALALADALGIEKFAFCGQSLGGMVGLWIAAHSPDRLTHLILANTSARADAKAMDTRRRTVLDRGMAAVIDAAVARFFSPQFVARRDRRVDWVRRTLLATNPIGYAGCCAAIRDMDQTASLAEIRTPTLVIGGDHDISMPWADHGAILAKSIAGATVAQLPGAHITCLEFPHSYTAAVAGFLLPAPADRFEAGLRKRRDVLGNAHVDRSMHAATDLTRAFQELITNYAWGTIWIRPGLDDRTRRLLVLAITASLGRWEEFRLHLSAAVAGETEWCDIEEVLLQVAVYAGLPAANTAFKIASEVRAEPSQA
jgi:3-oxoadipate enol-lactonase/4-carboxymuconolactone decarboxylase